jgi:hypothetical protein
MAAGAAVAYSGSMPRLRSLLALAAALGLAACSNAAGPSRLTETFTGVLDVGATNEHDFVVQQYGLVEITLTSLSPDASPLIQLGIGEPTDTGCVIDTSTITKVGTAPQLKGNATAGDWCVAISDIDNALTQPESYSLTVTHP